MIDAVQVLRDLLAKYDPERQCIDVEPDPGCLECTAGATPNRLNTGPCAYHRAEAAIRQTPVTEIRVADAPIHTGKNAPYAESDVISVVSPGGAYKEGDYDGKPQYVGRDPRWTVDALPTREPVRTTFAETAENPPRDGTLTLANESDP